MTEESIQDDGKGDKGTLLCCSFCGQMSQDVALLVQSPDANICNACVQICMEICAKAAKKIVLFECPFCGEKPEDMDNDGFGSGLVHCGCGVAPMVKYNAGDNESREAAYSLWNTRSTPCATALASGLAQSCYVN